jgi:hypothetical protein
MKTQRKIYHLLDSIGSGTNFRYLRKLNPKHNFVWDIDNVILLTDKIDGTTVQANNKGVYKRIDNFKKGDPKKHSATEEERYKLELITFFNDLTYKPEWKYIIDAISPYIETFRKIPDNITVYFEVFGEKIGTRYNGLSNIIRKAHDIRIFDITIDDKYAPFGKNVRYLSTIEFCEKYDLPHVDFQIILTRLIRLDVLEGINWLLDWLKSDKHTDPKLESFELEGWVIRQGNEIAKIRRNDLKIIKDD